jgi:DNA mismatch repair protein MutS2
MVRDGIPIPSKPNEPARVDFFSPILADIGDMQSVDGDLSTFSGHMLVCREVLKNAGRNALVLMDELGSGTDPNQGVAIARALLEALLDSGCRVAITTHYLELKQLASTDDRFNVAGMQFVGGRPTYKLLPGVIGESFALAVAERLELPESVIRRAYELLDTETRQLGDLMRDLEDQKLLVDQKTEELQKREKEMLEMMVEMKKQQQKLEMTQLTARREEARKFAAKLEEKERLLDGILEKLKGSGATKKVVADSWSDIRIVKREALSEAENVPGVASRLQQQLRDELDNYELIPISEMKGGVGVNIDDKVIVCKSGAFYGKEGVVKEVGKKIQVIVGGVPVRLTTTEIALPASSGRTHTNQSQNANAGGRRGGGERTMSKMAQRALDLDSSADSPVEMSSSSSQSSDRGATYKMKSNTVDCIGLNFEESKRKCIDAFSKATMQNRSIVFVLHGHGTGVLKKKIRTWLQGDRQWVKTFRPADQADGGDALTLVELKKQNLF